MGKTIEIPEGYEARIEGNKVILEKKESEDERIREAIESIIRVYGKTQGEWIAGYDMDTLVVHLRDAFAYLERQKEQKTAVEEVLIKAGLKPFKDGNQWNSLYEPLCPREGMLAWLKSLRPQPKQEWSETDKLHLNNAILVAKKEWGVNSYTARFLESLRDNYKNCNSRWKPSEEQIDALERAIVKMHTVDDIGILAELRDNLKKL